MRNLNGRSVFTYACVTVAGLALLALVLPRFNAPGRSIALAGIFLSIIPLVIIGAVLFYLFGSSKKEAKSLSHRTSLVMANTAATSIALSVLATIVSTYIAPFNPGTPKYALENTGVALLLIALACILILINNQKFVYWPLWNSKDRKSADERQRTVRNRVYEKSYRAMIGVLIVVAWFYGISSSSQRLHDELLQVSVLCLFGIPTIIAARQKDS